MSTDMSGHTEARCCMWGGRDGAAAMGEGGPCPREHPAPGPEGARMASVAIGDVAAELVNVVVGEPGFAAGKGAEVVAGVPFPLAVARVVVMVTGGGSRMRGGITRGRGKGPVA